MSRTQNNPNLPHSNLFSFFSYYLLCAFQGSGRSTSPEQRGFRDTGDYVSSDRRHSLPVYHDQDKKIIDELVHRIGRLEQVIRDKDREKDNTESYERKENLERRDTTPGRRERRTDSHDLEARVSYLTADVQELSEQVTSHRIASCCPGLHCAAHSYVYLLYLFLLCRFPLLVSFLCFSFIFSLFLSCYACKTRSATVNPNLPLPPYVTASHCTSLLVTIDERYGD